MTIDRARFQSTFHAGIDLSKPALRAALPAATLQRLDALAGADKVVPPAKLAEAFALVDAFDRNGSAHSFDETAAAVKPIWDALLYGASAADGRAIAAAARALIAADGAGFAVDSSPKSTEHARLRGNRPGGQDKLGWLQGSNKCNVFVCETLTRAGFEVPLVEHPGNVAHYQLAEQLPNSPRHFDRLRALADVKVGDVIVNDYPGRGGSTAHTEVITAIARDAQGNITQLETAGAHYDGAYTKDWTDLLPGLAHVKNGRFSDVPDDGTSEGAQGGTYFLRPKLRRAGSPTAVRIGNA